jgi:hypothetical protein
MWLTEQKNVMQVRSPVNRSDPIFPTFDGQISDREHYLVVHTPANPTCYWGSFLLATIHPGKALIRAGPSC